MRQSSFGCGSSQLWIRESDPDLIHFASSKIIGEHFYLCSEKGCIIQFFCQCVFSSYKHPVALYIYPNKIFIRVHSSKPDCVLTSSTGQLQNNGLIILEKRMPFTRHLFRIF